MIHVLSLHTDNLTAREFKHLFSTCSLNQITDNQSYQHYHKLPNRQSQLSRTKTPNNSQQ